MTLDKMAILAEHSLLRHLDPDDLRQLADYARMVHYPAGAPIFHKGDDGNGMLAITRGRVKICSYAPDGRELLLNIIDQGEIFGEIALLDGHPRTADAVALDDCDLLLLERRDVIPFLEKHPSVCLRLLLVLCQRFRRTSAFLEDSLSLDIPGRLARCLVRLVRVFGRPADTGITIDLKLSQQQLAGLIGATRESVNKQISAWRSSGLIATEDGFLTIRDMHGLEDLCGDDVRADSF